MTARTSETYSFFTDGYNPDEYFLMRHEYTKSLKAALVSDVTKNPLQSLLQHLILAKIFSKAIINQPSRFLAQGLIIFTFLKIFAEN